MVLPFLHDGSLPPDVAREAAGHMERCDGCREEYARLSRMMQFVRMTFEETKPATPPGAYRDAVMAKIRKRNRERTVVSWAVPAAASLFLVASITSYTFLNPGRGMNYLSSKPHSSVTQQAAQTSADETEIITAMYNYADVSVYDVLNQLGDDALDAEADFNEVTGE